MIFLATMLHHTPRMDKTCKDIRKKAASFAQADCPQLMARSP
jgi:hypothetical protein